jgi:hypothetical protein
MALRLVYLVFSRVLRRMLLLTRSDTANEIEILILILRHQLASIPI